MKLSEAFRKYALVMGAHINRMHDIQVAVVSGKVSEDIDALLTAESELHQGILHALEKIDSNVECPALSPKATAFISHLS